MAIIAHSHYFHLFKNREIDSLYFMNALSMLGTSMISVFVPIYFYEMGIPLWGILFFFLLRAVYVSAFTYALLPFINRLSDKMMMALGTPFLVIYFFSLTFVTGIDWLFFVSPAFLALYGALFFSGYHIDFSRSADKDNKTKQVGANIIIMDVVRLIVPVVGGVLIVGAGFSFVLILSGCIVMVSILPLLFFPKRTIAQPISFKSVHEALSDSSFKNFRRATFGYVVDHMNATIIWPLFIFLAVGSIKTLGLYVSLGFLAGAIAVYIMAKWSDDGKSAKVFTILGVGQSLLWFVRVMVENIGAIAGVHIGGYAFRDATATSWTSRYYTLLGQKEHSGVYVIAQELYYNLVRIAVFPFFIVIALVFPMSVFFPVLFALAGVFSLLFILAGR